MANKQIRNINSFKKAIIIALFLFLSIFAISSISNSSNNNQYIDSSLDSIIEYNVEVEKGKEYSTYEEVAAYIHTFKELPPNYMNKEEAHSKGWDGGNPQYDIGGNVCIGGDKFANLERILSDGKEYYECDVDYLDENRGPNRLIYTSDGKVYYTNDHYESYIELY